MGPKLTVKSFDDLLERFHRDSRIPFGQYVDPESKQHSGFLDAERLPNPGGMRSNQVLLELPEKMESVGQTLGVLV